MYTKESLDYIDPRKKTSILDYISESFINPIENLYDAGKNREEISIELGLTKWQVRKALQYIRKNLNSERRKVLNKLETIPLTQNQEQCILGTLLGDASLNRRNRNGTITIEYKVGHCYAQLEYLQHVGRILGKTIRKTKIKEGSKYTNEEYWNTITYYNFYELERIYAICYKENQKYVSNTWVDLLTPQAIAFWYMDDGTSSFTKPRDKTYINCRFSTLSFVLEEIQLLQDKLLSFNVFTKLHSHTDGKGLIIAIQSKSINAFIELITPYIVPCMKYKIKRYANE